MKKMRDIPAPRVRHAGGSATIRRIHEERPELLGKVMAEALQDAFEKYGGMPQCLSAEIGPNTTIRKTLEDGSSMGYPVMLSLTFRDDPDYVGGHANSVKGFAQDLRHAWLNQHTDHMPGAFRLTQQENGDFSLTVAHRDVAHLSSMVNRLLRQHALPSVDARYIAQYPQGAESRSR